jgi:hypothetical protein
MEAKDIRDVLTKYTRDQGRRMLEAFASLADGIEALPDDDPRLIALSHWPWEAVTLPACDIPGLEGYEADPDPPGIDTGDIYRFLDAIVVRANITLGQTNPQLAG